MKKAGDVASLTPAADGWSLRRGTAPPQVFTTLAEAAAALPAALPVHLALPCEALVIEGLTLPATERDELDGMVRLQLEKNLPYSLDEVSGDFVIAESSEKESSVISFVAPHSPLDSLCEPLRHFGRLPEKVTPYVLHVAAACPSDESVFAVYPEQGRTVLAICARSRLAWAHVFEGTDVARLAAELPQALLAATMEGVPTKCSRVLLADEARALTPVIQSVFALPIAALPVPVPTLDLSINLVPDFWRSAAQQQQRARRTRGQLQFAAVLYLLLAAGAVTYFILLQRQAKELGAKFAAVRPQLELVQTRQARSNTLAPAIEPGRFTVELLYLLQRALPAAEVRITEFDQQPAEWRVTGEAPNAGLAIDYVNRLKADPELAGYQINSSPPQLLPNESARFSIFGTR